MNKRTARFITCLISMPLVLATLINAACLIVATPAFSEDSESMLTVTPAIMEYSVNTVKPILDSSPDRDKLSLLLKVVDILNDSKTGIHSNQIKPNDYFTYHILDKIYLGFLFTWRFSPAQKEILQRWHGKYMQTHPADVFFAPSADEIIRSKAAFGCTHYARAFIAVVKALGLVEKPEYLRYVISSKADDYNRALEKEDLEMTINGHQFVMAKVDSKWIAINTTKSEIVTMPQGFSPDSCIPPRNIPMRFESYPAGIVFLLRKIGKDYNDDCGDNSLSHLMNISRSSDPEDASFEWEVFVNEKWQEKAQ